MLTFFTLCYLTSFTLGQLKSLTDEPIVIKGGSCHFCDLCPSSLPVPPMDPPPKEKVNCFKTTDPTVRCMTKSIMYSNTDRGDSSRRIPVPTEPEKVRSCLNNGTLKCLEKHMHLKPNDKKCLKIEGVRPEAYSKYKACISAARSEEWKEILEEGNKGNESLRSSRSVVKLMGSDYTVDITVCSCTGFLCNNHRQEQLDNAEVVNARNQLTNGMGPSLRLVIRPVNIFITVLSTLIFFVYVTE